MGSTVRVVVILLVVASLPDILRPTQGKPLPRVGKEDGTSGFLSALGTIRHRPRYGLKQRDRPVLVSALASSPAQPPRHHGRYLSQPPVPVNDRDNGRSMCKWRYEDNVQPNRFPSTLKVAVKEYTGSRCRDPATGAPRADLVCLPIDYELNVLRKNSEGEWHESVEYVTIGFTCAGSNATDR
ncbi:Hypp4258 [Branchiostoma lanceolatum]|uniref:Hypp4258 protein n=1 Tax=Branchiostoma lanceolatum TaxID=7740 RepID=A0A8K0A819_BRALA|nr:Hypp4258 [Branchiostoma lanceolatum]